MVFCLVTYLIFWHCLVSNAMVMMGRLQIAFVYLFNLSFSTLIVMNPDILTKMSHLIQSFKRNLSVLNGSRRKVLK